MSKVKLKPLSIKTLELLRTWRNKNRKYFIFQGIISKKKQLQWFNEYKNNANDHIYIIYYDKVPVGSISYRLHNRDIELGRAMIGVKEFERKGIMGQALKEILKKVKYNMVFLEVLKKNNIAISFYKKHNFHIARTKYKTYVMEQNK